MNIKKIIGGLICATIISVIALFFVTTAPSNMPLDIVLVNDIVQITSQNWSNMLAEEMFPEGIDFVVLTDSQQLRFATNEGLNETTHAAMTNRDTLVNVFVGEERVGYVIFYNPHESLIAGETVVTRVGVSGVLIIFALFCAGYLLYLNKNVVKPFKDLEFFAQQVARGDLSVSLEMDKHQIFGAFTESFDLMREELHRARVAEAQANLSKKELIAQISHDIKTPVASIKAVAELMDLLTEDEELKEKLGVINGKANQISTLITDMFHATLEELQALPVTNVALSSEQLPVLLNRVDYQQHLMPFSIPDALIIGDLQRIEQVFDNVITNAYKYAKTDIQVISVVKEGYLMMEFLDFGTGVPDKELHLILQKFYRGNGVGNQIGYGLGLYISKSLMVQMGGDLEVFNHDDGFGVRLVFGLVTGDFGDLDD